LFAGFTYLQLLDVTTYLNHYYLASLLALLLACSPAHHAWSVDALLRPTLARTHVRREWLLLFRFQVGLVYTFAGLAKAHGDWLWRAQPLRIWLGAQSDLPWVGGLLAQPWSALAMSWGGFVFDLAVPWLLLHARTRPYAYAGLIAFHLIVGKLFPIGMFPWIMIVAATVFLAPDWPRLGARVTCAPVDAPARWATASLWAYCALQLLLPLRALGYGGDVRWHEQGMRFSWQVMVREKSGSVSYRVRRKVDGRAWEVRPRAYLTPVQERELTGQPDLILQLAHHIARDFARRGLGRVEVRADARVSLNGRPSAPLIDPEIDLTTVEDGLTRASWIMPAPEPSSSDGRSI
jgi:hypothetical protein